MRYFFRGKRVDNGEWVYGYYIKATHHWHEHGVHEDWIATDIIQNGGWCNVRGKYAVIPETVGQYTGYEKNGNKIFEGDIVRTQRGKFYEIKLYKGAWVVWSEKAKLDIEKWDFLNTFLPTVEVIGNIHNNPELLKGGE